jgi:hypothetical protein
VTSAHAVHFSQSIDGRWCDGDLPNMALKPRKCIDSSHVDAISDALGISLDADFEQIRSLVWNKGSLLVGGEQFEIVATQICNGIVIVSCIAIGLVSGKIKRFLRIDDKTIIIRRGC